MTQFLWTVFFTSILLRSAVLSVDSADLPFSIFSWMAFGNGNRHSHTSIKDKNEIFFFTWKEFFFARVTKSEFQTKENRHGFILDVGWLAFWCHCMACWRVVCVFSFLHLNNMIFFLLCAHKIYVWWKQQQHKKNEIGLPFRLRARRKM